MANKKNSRSKKAKYTTKKQRSLARKQNLERRMAMEIRESDESSESTIIVTAFRCIKCPHRPIVMSEGLDAHRDFHKIKKTLHSTQYAVAATLPVDHPVIPHINKSMLRKRTDYKGDAYYEFMSPLVLSRKMEEDPLVKDMFAGALQRQKERLAGAGTASAADSPKACTPAAAVRKSSPRLQKLRKTLK